MECALFVRKHGTCFESMQSEHQYDTRHRDLYRVPQTKYTLVQRNVNNHALQIYNALSPDIKSLEGKGFKSELKNFLLEEAYYDVKEFLK